MRKVFWYTREDRGRENIHRIECVCSEKGKSFNSSGIPPGERCGARRLYKTTWINDDVFGRAQPQADRIDRLIRKWGGRSVAAASFIAWPIATFRHHVWINKSRHDCNCKRTVSIRFQRVRSSDPKYSFIASDQFWWHTFAPTQIHFWTFRIDCRVLHIYLNLLHISKMQYLWIHISSRSF